MTTDMIDSPAEATVPPAGTPRLNAALAAFNAEVPEITKSKSGKVEGTTQAGKPYSYTYEYADLADINTIAGPLLGKHGLAFTSRPTLINGTFCLVYELRHSSGEQIDGVFPLPADGKPQELGKLLTYYRRYAMCAVCNIAAAGEDNDAASANREQRFDTNSAGAAFDRAVPAPSRRQPPAGANGTAVHPLTQDRAAVSTTELDPDAQEFANEGHEARTLPALHEIHVRSREARKLAALITNPATGGTGGLGAYLHYRKGLLQKADKALKGLEAAGKANGLEGPELDAEFARLAGCSLEGATAEQLDQVAGKLRSLASAGTP